MNKLKMMIIGALAVAGAWCAQAEEKCTDCITFSADKAFGMKLWKKGTPAAPSLEYSTDQLNWSSVSVGNDYDAAKDGDTYKIYFRGTGNAKLSASPYAFNAFTNTASSVATAIDCSGNIMTLLNYATVAAGGEPKMDRYAFCGVFQGFAALTTAPELSATTLAEYCYNNMFKGCTSLTAAPKLSAMTLAEYCCSEMFGGCTSLTKAPALNATTLERGCYKNMFKGCTSLTSAPELQAVELKQACYNGMFYGCTSLTEAPALDATTLAQTCYSEMFRGCTSLTSAPALPATKLEQRCYDGMFNGCTSLTKASELSAMTLASQCCLNMFNGCTSLTKAPALNATTLASQCYDAMFYGCTSLTSVPELNATTLADYCYRNMFKGCTSLEVNTADPGKKWKLPSATTKTSWNENMFNGIKAGSTVPAAPAQNTTYYIASAPKETDCITFSADKSFGIRLTGGYSGASVEWSTDQVTWLTLNVNTDYAAKQDGETYKIHFRGTGNKRFSKGGTSLSCTFKVATGSAATAIACSGNIMTLLDFTTVAQGKWPTMEANTFGNLFNGFAELTTTPELPARSLQDRSYASMFKGCASLTAVPELPATSLGGSCYEQMFYNCKSLVVNTAAPGKGWKIPATSEATDWSKNMFTGTGGTMAGAPALNTTYYVKSDYDEEIELGGGMKARDYGNGQVSIEGAGALTDISAIADKAITNLYISTGVTGIGDSLFASRRDLRDVQIAATCTAIGADAFHRCQNITNVTVKATETVTVGDYAFYRCNSLEKLTFASKPTWGETPFSFYSAIYMKDGVPEVYAIPNVEITGYVQVLKGSNDLETWTPVGDETKKDYKFFKIELVAPF